MFTSQIFHLSILHPFFLVLPSNCKCFLAWKMCVLSGLGWIYSRWARPGCWDVSVLPIIYTFSVTHLWGEWGQFHSLVSLTLPITPLTFPLWLYVSFLLPVLSGSTLPLQALLWFSCVWCSCLSQVIETAADAAFLQGFGTPSSNLAGIYMCEGSWLVDGKGAKRSGCRIPTVWVLHMYSGF